MKIFNPNDIKKVQAAIKEQDVTSQSIEFEIPFSYELRLNDNINIKMQIKQLSYREYQQYYAYHSYITRIMTEIETKSINVNDIRQIFDLCFYLTRLSECLNPNVFIDKEIIEIYKANYKAEIKKKNYKVLFNTLIDIYKHFNVSELDFYKPYVKAGKFQLGLIFNFSEYRRLKDSDLEYLQNLAKIVIDYYISKILYKTKFSEIIEIFNQVLLYNTYIKKNLMTVKQEISNRMEGFGKQIRTYANFSTTTDGENYLTLE